MQTPFAHPDTVSPQREMQCGGSSNRTQIGIYAKVAAIDAATRVEVTVMGPASANPRTLEQAALRKLNARLRRDR